MENAGRAAAELLHARFGSESRVVRCFCGPGNNGGDGLVVARQLLVSGWDVRVTLLPGSTAESVTADHAWNLSCVRALGVKVRAFTHTDEASEPVVVDALFGTGLTRELTGIPLEAVRAIGRCGAQVVALDVPSGLDADTGAVHGDAVRADLTVTFAAAKAGLLRRSAAPYVGELVVRHIGVPYPLPPTSDARSPA